MRIAAIAVLVVVTIAVRAPDAVSESLWWDEVRSARAITTPSPVTAVGRIRSESSPPLWFFLGRLVHGGGELLERIGAPSGVASVEAVRLIAVLASAVLTVLVVVYASRFMPFPGALLAGLLAGLAWQSVVHGKELRAYALLAALVVALPLALEATLRNPTRRRLLGFAVLVAAGSMTHYFFLVALGTAAMWVAWTRQPAWRRVGVAAAVGLLPLIAWLPILVYQSTRVNRYFPAFTPRRVFNLYSDLFATGEVWTTLGTAGRALVIVAVLSGAAVLVRRGAEGQLCAALAVVPVAATAFVWLLGLRIFDVRNLLIVLPFAAIAIAALAAVIPFRPVAAVALAGVGVAMVAAFWVNRDLGRTPLDEVAEALAGWSWGEGDVIVRFGSVGEQSPLAWHLPGHPRLVSGRPSVDRCRTVYAVVDTRTGQRWLEDHAGAVTARASFPSYTGWVAGRRKTLELVAARLSAPPGLVAEAAERGGFPDYVTGAPAPPCVSAAYP